MSLWILAVVACVLAGIPALLFLRNIRAFMPPPWPLANAASPRVSLLIPARNEAEGIRPAVEAALASEDVDLEVLVLDDHSEDATAAIVAELAARDARVRLLQAPPLPPGWSGKQHACAVLARHTTAPTLVFVDADVRLAPHAIERLVAFLDASGAALASGVPRQMTPTLGEHLIIPLIHFLLVGFLPFHRMRASIHPAYGSGCGQLFIARRDAYEAVGGHAAIRTSLHDGLQLPRAFRAAGYMTDLFDATPVATCRMYTRFSEVWNGLAKNATEGLAAPATILPATVLLLGGQVLPFVLLPVVLLAQSPHPVLVGLTALGSVAAYAPRVLARRRFRQSWLSTLLHPCGMVVLVAIQWYACVRALMGRPATWKGRSYQTMHHATRD